MASNAEKCITLFGGVMNMSRATLIDPATISRFALSGPRGYGGKIPPRYNAKILTGARKERLNMKAVNATLQQNVCPCCGQKLEPGIVISPNIIRAFVQANS